MCQLWFGVSDVNQSCVINAILTRKKWLRQWHWCSLAAGVMIESQFVQWTSEGFGRTSIYSFNGLSLQPGQTFQHHWKVMVVSDLLLLTLASSLLLYFFRRSHNIWRYAVVQSCGQVQTLKLWYDLLADAVVNISIFIYSTFQNWEEASQFGSWIIILCQKCYMIFFCEDGSELPCKVLGGGREFLIIFLQVLEWSGWIKEEILCILVLTIS